MMMGTRQHHTIISRELIKPSSPTPSHLSSLDQLTQHKYIPMIFFYPNNNTNYNLITVDDKVLELKKSLSRSLTRYYPFAGRLQTPTTPYIDCNDAGVVFLEAKNNSHLEEFQNYLNEHDETLDQLFADDMIYFNSPFSTSLVGVQLNHFTCGGMILAVSLSHIVGDASTVFTFVNHWASVARYDYKEELPHIINFPCTNTIHPEAQVTKKEFNNRVTKKFVFPNSKLNDLKKDVMASMTAGLINQLPTRVEVLASLLYKTAVAAATAKSGCFKPSCLFIPVDLRNKFVPKLPQSTMGNLVSPIMVTSKDTSETSLSVVVSEIKIHKEHHEQLQSMHQATEHYKNLLSKMVVENYSNTSYWCSSFCRFPYRKADFGWGKPTSATMVLRWIDTDGFLLTDTPDGNAIDAYVALDNEDMEIFQNNKELLSFCDN